MGLILRKGYIGVFMVLSSSGSFWVLGNLGIHVFLWFVLLGLQSRTLTCSAAVILTFTSLLVGIVSTYLGFGFFAFWVLLAWVFWV